MEKKKSTKTYRIMINVKLHWTQAVSKKKEKEMQSFWM